MIVNEVSEESAHDWNDPVESEVLQNAVSFTSAHKERGQSRVEHGARDVHAKHHDGEHEEADDGPSRHFVAVVVCEVVVGDHQPGQDSQEEGPAELHHDDVEGRLVLPWNGADSGSNGRSSVLVEG